MTLIERLEQAEAGSLELFVEVYNAIYGDGGTPWASDACHRERFMFLIHWEAYLEAAILLVPEGCDWLRKDFSSLTVAKPDPNEKLWAKHFDGWHASPAIALVIASLKAAGHE